jgi:hypothetical protein
MHRDELPGWLPSLPALMHLCVWFLNCEVFRSNEWRTWGEKGKCSRYFCNTATIFTNEASQHTRGHTIAHAFTNEMRADKRFSCLQLPVGHEIERAAWREEGSCGIFIMLMTHHIHTAAGVIF